jgi:hypothetical protein
VSIAIVGATYLAVGAVVAARVHREGVLGRRRHPLLGSSEMMVLSITAVAVGALWAFFVPGLLVVGWRSFRRASPVEAQRIHTPCLDAPRS